MFKKFMSIRVKELDAKIKRRKNKRKYKRYQRQKLYGRPPTLREWYNYFVYMR